MTKLIAQNAVSIFLVSLFTLTLQAIPSSQARDDLNEKIAKANELLDNGKAKSAAGILQRIIASNPDNAQAHMILGAALAAQVDHDEYDAAIAEEQTTLKLDPKSYGARKILGQIYTNLHKTQDAINMLEEACALNASSYATRRNLGIAQMTAGKNDDAIQSFKKAIQINPEKTDAHVKLSTLFIRKDNYKDAIAEARKAVKTDVSNPESHLALGNALLASGDKLGSIEPYEAALQANLVKRYRNPLTHANALSGLGWAFSVKNAGKKEFDEAVLDQRQAIKIFPAYGPAYVRLAELFWQQGKIKDADAIYKATVKLSQEDAGVSTAYAKYMAKTGRKDEARIILKEVLQKTPDCKQAREALSELDNERAS